MRKTLISLLLGLSSCVSQQYKCPNDEEILKAGFKIYAASEMIESPKEFDHNLARTTFFMANDFYFNCEGDHRDRHYQEAMERATKYFGFNEEGKKKFARNVKKIKEEIESVSYTRK